MNPPSQFVSLYRWISPIALYRRTFVHNPEHYKQLFWISQFSKFSTTKSLLCDHEWRRSRIAFFFGSCDHEHVENISGIPDPSWLPPSCPYLLQNMWNCPFSIKEYFGFTELWLSESTSMCANTFTRSYTVSVSNVSCLSFIREQMDWISLVSSSCFYQL